MQLAIVEVLIWIVHRRPTRGWEEGGWSNCHSSHPSRSSHSLWFSYSSRYSPNQGWVSLRVSFRV
jgi:hypothetical protein